MSQSPNLALPYLLASQAQKHVIHNEALRTLDAVVQLAANSRSVSQPPAQPQEGDRYLVGAQAGGDWTAREGQLAIWLDGAWMFHIPAAGWIAWISDEEKALAFDGQSWLPVTNGLINPASLVGVNATADNTNRLAVKSDAVLLSHDDVTPGSGDVRLVLNKASQGNTASALFQSNWSGRAEFGLAGNDDWLVKVSSDGGAWSEAIRADSASGILTVQGFRHAQTLKDYCPLVFTPWGAGTFYRVGATAGQNPRTAQLSSATGDMLTLSTTVADLFFDTQMQGVSFVRIWNLSRPTPEAAWVLSRPSDSQLQVTDAAHIASWQPGDTLQVGDPGGGLGQDGRVIALDISPMLANLFGATIRQKGIVVSAALHGGGHGDAISITSNGASNTTVDAAVTPSAGAQAGGGTTIVPSTEPSPISSSNLVLVRESIAGTAGMRQLASQAIIA